MSDECSCGDCTTCDEQRDERARDQLVREAAACGGLSDVGVECLGGLGCLLGEEW